MLSKSQARMFFLGGTFLFSAIFIGLTVDTHRQLPQRNHTNDLTEDVVKGKRIGKKTIVWDVIQFWVKGLIMHQILQRW
jgi:nitric oxide reductase subunit C